MGGGPGLDADLMSCYINSHDHVLIGDVTTLTLEIK